MKRILLVAAILLLVNACDKEPGTQATGTAPKEAIESPAAAIESIETPLTGPMSFFITSVGAGDGANYGGLEGADEHCQDLAMAAGAGNKTWRAYLSASGKYDPANPENNIASVHARDRIGTGPWFNAKGEMIARDVEQLHSNNNINKQTALSENGEPVNGRGDKPNEHDILTGSREDGTAFSPHMDTTCGNWTRNEDGAAAVGHHDLTGPMPDNWARSWNFSHFSKGCSQDALKSTGGAGLLYCFAID